MTPKEIKSLIKTLRASGISHYKTPELELTLSPLIEKQIKPIVMPVATPQTVSRETPLDAPYEEEKPIEHTDVNLVSLLKLSDEDLLDRLIPDHTKEAEESANDAN
jgi:hypothetical protein